MKCGTYYICQYCDMPIFRNGVAVRIKRGRGYSKEVKNFHKHCFKKLCQNKRKIKEIWG